MLRRNFPCHVPSLQDASNLLQNQIRQMSGLFPEKSHTKSTLCDDAYSPHSWDALSRCSCRVSQPRETRTLLHRVWPGYRRLWQRWRCSSAHHARPQLLPSPKKPGSISTKKLRCVIDLFNAFLMLFFHNQIVQDIPVQ